MIKYEKNSGELDLLLETRSPEIQEVVGKMPSWIIRRGLVIITLFIIAISTVAYLVKYPDKIAVKVMINNSNAPVILKSNRNFQIDTFLVSDNALVKSTELIAFFKSDINIENLNSLDSTLQSIQRLISPDQISKINFDTSYRLSDIQSSYNDLIIAVNNYKKIKGVSIPEQLNYQQKLIDNFRALQYKINEWKTNNIISSPIDGKVVYLKPLKNGYYTHVDEEILAITPIIDGIIHVSGKISARDYDKVRVNQSILITVDGFPVSEYGYILAKIKKVSNININNEYIIDIDLVNGFSTTRKKILPTLNSFQGIGEIQIAEKSVVDRILENFKITV
jgi:hypothetical protein